MILSPLRNMSNSIKEDEFMRHVGNRDSNKNRSLLSVIIIKLLYYMTAILYKALYMAVLIIGCPFYIVGALI